MIYKTTLEKNKYSKELKDVEYINVKYDLNIEQK